MALIDWQKTQDVKEQRKDSERLRNAIARTILWLLATGAFLSLYAASWLLLLPLAG